MSNSTRPFRIGYGYDVHRLSAGRRCVLAGVEIPSKFGPLGHSDADVVLHALADAILGALGEPDIGHWFPPADAQWRDLDSARIVELALQKCREKGYVVGNADLTVIAEQPKIGPHREKMVERLAELLDAPKDCVGLKATTNEQLGAIGAGDGIAAHAAVLLQREQAE